MNPLLLAAMRPRTRFVSVSGAPGTPSNLRTLTVSTSAVQLAWDAPSSGGDVTSYDLLRGGVVIQTGIAGPSTVDSTVTAGQGYSYTVRAVGPGGTGPESGALAVEVPEPGEVEPFFETDFEGGQFNNTADFSFGGSGSRIVTDNPMTGTHSLWFPFGPTEPDGGSHWWSEQRFSHKPLQEYWMEYYTWIPENYFHYREHNSNNNKFHSAWTPNGYSAPGGGALQLWAVNDGTGMGTGDSTANYGRYGPYDTHLIYPPQTRPTGGIIFTSEHRGTWQRIRVHRRLSDLGLSNGITRLWRGDDLIVECANDENGAPQDNFYIAGYLWGYDNGRFQEQTDFYVDLFAIWDANPGWV